MKREIGKDCSWIEDFISMWIWQRWGIDAGSGMRRENGEDDETVGDGDGDRADSGGVGKDGPGGVAETEAVAKSG